jgi:NAD(P)H dehydrogenase (quinone)
MILVTGAAGKTGRSILQALRAKGTPVRALVHRPEQVQAVARLGAERVVAGDMRDPATMDEAVRGVRAVYHICPNMSPDELAIGGVVTRAARAAGVERFVFHSVLHPQTEKMPHHWQKLRVEELLFETGLSYTILQPAAYMQNLLAYWPRIAEEGVYAVPYAVDTKLGMVDLEDVAAVAATVLTEPGHAGATYELTSGEVLTPAQVAAVLETLLGRAVRAEAVPLDAWERSARASGLGDYQVQTLLQMFRYYEGYGFWGNSHVLGWLLGHPPARFEDFVRRILAAQRGSAPD